MTAAAVNVFVIEPTRYCVSGVASRPSPSSATPIASSSTVSPRTTTRALTLGRRCSD
jgi:hypothetical protein